MRNKKGQFIKGFRHTEKSKKKISKNNSKFWLGKHHSKETKKKISQNNIGNGHTEETKRKIKKSSLERHAIKNFGFQKGNHPKTEFKKGNKHPDWQGGKSFEPYGLEFNEDLKEVIRNRDRRKCQICEKTELENKVKLSVHHIDYDKRNNNPNNLISLCNHCHTKTNFRRDYWINYFKKKI